MKHQNLQKLRYLADSISILTHFLMEAMRHSVHSFNPRLLSYDSQVVSQNAMLKQSADAAAKSFVGHQREGYKELSQ